MIGRRCGGGFEVRELRDHMSRHKETVNHRRALQQAEAIRAQQNESLVSELESAPNPPVIALDVDNLSAHNNNKKHSLARFIDVPTTTSNVTSPSTTKKCKSRAATTSTAAATIVFITVGEHHKAALFEQSYQ
eukprot:PhM_4_TR8863/c0_g1_i1/m.52480